jgi:hypothetical protein
LLQVAFPAFRDTRASPVSPSLVDYFDDAGVSSYLTLHEDSGGNLLVLGFLALRDFFAGVVPRPGPAAAMNTELVAESGQRQPAEKVFEPSLLAFTCAFGSLQMTLF